MIYITSVLKRSLQLVIFSVILVVFAVAIWISNVQLGAKLREQVLSKRSEVLQAISLVHQVNLIEAYGDLSVENPADQLLIMEEISELSGADGFRLYSPEANYLYSFPENITEGKLSEHQLQIAKSLSSGAMLIEQARVEDWIIPPDSMDSDEGVPILAIILPIHIAEEDELLGISQLIFDGEDILYDIIELESRINKQSIFIFFIGAGIISLVLLVAFRLLGQSQNRLARRTEALNKANQALALSNKTHVIGSIATHLIHGLRNPLLSLKSYINNESLGDVRSSDAVEAVDRMEKMIDNVVSTIRDNEDRVLYDITVCDLLTVFQDRFMSVLNKNNVILKVESIDESRLDNREAGLVLLIIENLVSNSVDACKNGGEISLHTLYPGVIRVSDNGSGLSKDLQGKLFQAGSSAKMKGSGLGLAISKQLANSIGAELLLVETSKNGTVFELCLAAGFKSN